MIRSSKTNPPRRSSSLGKRFGMAFWVLIALLIPSVAVAQTTTVTMRGTVVDASSKGAVDGATVTVRSAVTGFVFTAVTGSDGRFTLGGLPAGPVALSVEAASHKLQTKELVLQLGQAVDVTLELAPESIAVEEVNVFGNTVIETRTSVVSTNVTPEQIESLPQNNRNFLNFAILAPGVRVSDDEFRKDVRVLGQPASATNVFIDGVSYKNDVLEGGVVGQDASRGNPFPQNAVQEFQVLTQNFKAEYERASTGIISAVTRSGGSELDGDVFLYYQPKEFYGQNVFDANNNVEKPDYKRYQGGFDIGGPIVKDKLTGFASFEENYQNRAGRVILGSANPGGFDTSVFDDDIGTFTSPFRSKLFFGKLSWQPGDNQAVDFTYNRRDESDERGFGGLNSGPQTALERAENIDITVDTLAAKHRLIRSNFINELTLQWQSATWNPRPMTTDPQLNYFGLIELGSRNNEQDFQQDRWSLREDFSYVGIPSHTLKFGAVLNKSKYDVTKLFGANGQLNFRNSGDDVDTFNTPFEGFVNAGDPNYSADNTSYGIYAQDDWSVNDKLTFSYGIRWDYESDVLNTDFVTPSAFVDALEGGITADGYWNSLGSSGQENYFSDGSNRKPFKSAFQPRLGFSYDLKGDGRQVLFGGVGRYYDRDIFNVFFDESFRLQWRTYRFCFYDNPTQQANCGASGIAWDEAYRRPGALRQLIGGDNPIGKAEIFLIPNDLEMPYNDQLSLGYRHSFGSTIASVTATMVRGKNGFTYIWGNRDFETGNLTDVSTDFSNLLIGVDDKEYWYKGLYLQLNRPLGIDAKFGYTLTYTLSQAEQRGNDAFSLDEFTVGDYPKAPTPDDEAHRIVATAIAKGPWDLTFSGTLQLGSGLPFFWFDARNGFDFKQIETKESWSRPDRKAFLIGRWAYRQVDFRVEKQFKLAGDQSLAVSLDAFNLFDFDNYGCLDTFVGPGNTAPTERANCTIGPTAQYQIGLKYGF